MSTRSIGLSDSLYEYLLSISLRETEIQRQLREATSRLPHGSMQISPEQGQFMALLVKLIGAKKCLEIGTFTGYSALAVAMALPDDGKLIACDVNEEWTSIGKDYWARANVAQKIDLRLGAAAKSLSKLIEDGEIGSFDFVFIDADKVNYTEYYNLSLQLLRSGGLILIDNVLWSGNVADPKVNDPDTVALRQLNKALLNDQRITLSVLPVGDGLTLCRKS